MTKKLATRVGSRITKQRAKDQYQVGKAEFGALANEPYTSELLELWKFRPLEDAQRSAKAIYERFLFYRKKADFIGMDMSRKFLLMGHSRARRYARTQKDVFKNYLDKVESDLEYIRMRADWKIQHG